MIIYLVCFLAVIYQGVPAGGNSNPLLVMKGLIDVVYPSSFEFLRGISSLEYAPAFMNQSFVKYCWLCRETDKITKDSKDKAGVDDHDHQPQKDDVRCRLQTRCQSRFAIIHGRKSNIGSPGVNILPILLQYCTDQMLRTGTYVQYCIGNSTSEYECHTTYSEYVILY